MISNIIFYVILGIAFVILIWLLGQFCLTKLRNNQPNDDSYRRVDKIYHSKHQNSPEKLDLETAATVSSKHPSFISNKKRKEKKIHERSKSEIIGAYSTIDYPTNE